MANSPYFNAMPPKNPPIRPANYPPTTAPKIGNFTQFKSGLPKLPSIYTLFHGSNK